MWGPAPRDHPKKYASLDRGAGIRVGEEPDVEVLEPLVSGVHDLEVEPHEFVDSRGGPLERALAYENVERIVLRLLDQRFRGVVPVHAREHLLADGRVVLVDQPVAVVVEAVLEILVEDAVMIVVSCLDIERPEAHASLHSLERLVYRPPGVPRLGETRTPAGNGKSET